MEMFNPHDRYGETRMHRGIIAAAGVLIRVALGAVYAWSVFRGPLVKQFGWSIAEVTLTFTICIMALGFAAFFAGLWLQQVRSTGGSHDGRIVIRSRSFSGELQRSEHLLVVPDLWAHRRNRLGLRIYCAGCRTCEVVCGTAGLSNRCCCRRFRSWCSDYGTRGNRTDRLCRRTADIRYLGIAYAIITVAAGWFTQNPPADWKPAGWQPRATETRQRATRDYSLSEALRTWQWWLLWGLLFLNTSAGISVISQEAPLFQDLAKVSAIAAAEMVGVVAIGNAVGRVFWAWASDLMTRRMTFVVMYALQAVLFWIFPGLHSAALVTFVAFILLMCYGGGFGTMPAFTADYFGPKNVGPIYGLMLTAWGFASAFGPILVARMRESTGQYGGALHLIAVIPLASIALAVVVRPPKTADVAIPPEDLLASTSPLRGGLC